MTLVMGLCVDDDIYPYALLCLPLADLGQSLKSQSELLQNIQMLSV